MKFLLAILLSIPSILKGQDSLTWFPGEYVNSVLNGNTGKLFNVTNLPFTVSGLSGYTIIGGAGGAHHAVCIDNAGNLHVIGDNGNGELGLGNNTSQSTWQLVTTDSLGNSFGNVRYAYCGGTAIGWITMVLKWDGTLWISGCSDGFVRGNGTYGGASNRFVQIVFSGSPFITRALVGFTGLALDASGNVYTWGGNPPSSFFAPYVLARGTPTPSNIGIPTIISLPGPAKMIAGSGSNYQFAILTNGKPYGWAFYGGYIGVGSPNQGYGSPDMSVTTFNPWQLDTAWGISTVDTIACSSTGTYFITGGSAYYLGDNSNGGAGNGQELDFRHLAYGAVWSPYAWSQGPGELMARKPVQIAPGKNNFSRIFTSSSLTFYGQLSDVNGNYYFMGRNKGGIAGNAIGGIDSVAGDLQSARPNSWQEPWVTRITPFQYPHDILTTCPWFNDTTGAPLESTYPVNKTGANPVSNAGSNQSISTNTTTLKGSYTYSSPARGLRTRLWSHVSGPSATMPLVAQDTTTVINMAVGTHVFKYFIMDNNFKTDSTTVTITINPSNTINIPAGSKISVH